MAPQTIPSDTASSSKSDTIHRRRRRPVPVLTLHHLTLYSSSSPHNLLEKTHTSPEASSTTAYGHTTASWSKPTTPPAAAQPAYASNRPHRTEMPPPPHQVPLKARQHATYIAKNANFMSLSLLNSGIASVYDGRSIASGQCAFFQAVLPI
ncbi:hypothetical protein BC940DRAFT_147895 [Gongronella butleri]|nr:hypothetical protein BC940DRAFT_147895 [Gongronella butleri]